MEPKIIEKGSRFQVTILKSSMGIQHGGAIGGAIGGIMGGTMGGTIDEMMGTLTDRQKEVLKIISNDNKLSIRIIARKLGVNISAVQEHVDKLKEKGVIERVGGTRGHWNVKLISQ